MVSRARWSHESHPSCPTYETAECALSELRSHHSALVRICFFLISGYASWADTPKFRGYSSFYGYFSGSVDHFTKKSANTATANHTSLQPLGGGLDFWENTTAAWSQQGPYSLDLYTDMAIGTVREYAAAHPTPEARATSPLLLAFMHQTAHEPIESRGDNGMEVDARCAGGPGGLWRQVFCSMVVQMDDSTATLRDAYTELGLWDNTLMYALSSARISSF